MDKLIRASALVLLLACSASAGVMGHGVYDPPPPPPPQQSSLEAQEPAVTDQPQTATESEEAAIQLIVNVALDLLALL